MSDHSANGPLRLTNIRSQSRLPIMAIAAWACLFSSGAQAGLGGTIPTAKGPVEDARSMHARSFSTLSTAAGSTSSSYSAHQIILPDGGIATEFSDAGGFVFAVSWAAPTMPDLASLLGVYKPLLDRAQQRQQASQIRSPRLLNAASGDWTIVSSGHLRAYSGYSFLSSRLPTGFDLAKLR